MEEGWIIVVVGLTVVFASLILLFSVFEYAVPAAMRLHRRLTAPTDSQRVQTSERETTSGEEIAAVAAAVYLLMAQTHDEENAILTIHKAKKDYSPWSSKIYVTHNLNSRQS